MGEAIELIIAAGGDRGTVAQVTSDQESSKDAKLALIIGNFGTPRHAGEEEGGMATGPSMRRRTAGPALRYYRENPPSWATPVRDPTWSLGVQDVEGDFVVLAQFDGRYLSTEVAGGFTGRVTGPYATTGTVGFDWFAYEDTTRT